MYTVWCSSTFLMPLPSRVFVDGGLLGGQRRLQPLVLLLLRLRLPSAGCSSLPPPPKTPTTKSQGNDQAESEWI
jgi:hypothetical protein